MSCGLICKKSKEKNFTKSKKLVISDTMKVEEYLKKTGIRPSALAKRCNRSPADITHITPRKDGRPPLRKPSKTLLDKLSKVTGGQVSHRDYD